MTRASWLCYVAGVDFALQLIDCVRQHSHGFTKRLVNISYNYV